MLSLLLILYRRVLPVALPLLLIAAGWLALPQVELLRKGMPKIFIFLPLIIYVFTIALSLHFNLTRVAWLLFSFAAAYAGYRYLNGAKDREALRLVLAALLPINVVFFAFCRERGIWSLHGFSRLLLIAGEVMFGFWLIGPGRGFIPPLRKYRIVQLDLLNLVPLPQVIIAIVLTAALLLIIAFYLYRTPIENAFAGVLFTMLAAVFAMGRENSFIYHMTASGIVMLVGVIRNVHYMAYRDELTGLMGRRALNERMLMLGRRYTVAMLDVDHFKKFNDTYGHDAGDQVLKMVAGKMKGVGGGGRPYRYGGEEFTVLFPGRGAAAAEPVLETLRVRIAESYMGLRGKDRVKSTMKGKAARGTTATARRVSVTISIGLAQREGGGRPEEVLKAADEALYRAKKKGRNQVSR